MKKFIKVLTSTLLVIAMVLTGLPVLPELDLSKVDWQNFSFKNVQMKLGGIAEAFAGGSSSSTWVPNRTADGAQKTITSNVSPNGTRLSSCNDSYILEVNTVSTSKTCRCRYIIVSYYATPEAERNKIISTQYLTVDGGNVYSENYTKGSSYITGKYGYLGSKASTYTMLLRNSGFDSAYAANTDISKCFSEAGTFYGINNAYVAKQFSSYKDWATTVTGSSPNTKYKTPEEKASQAPFKNKSTDYIRFKFEYGFYKLASLSFYCEDSGGDPSSNIDFTLQDWALYLHDGEFQSDGTFNPGTTRLENYAFVSDSMGLSFNGTKLYQSNITDDSYFDCIGGGCYVFDTGNLTDTYRYDMRYAFNDLSNAGQKVSTDDRTILNFGININSEFGSGIYEGMANGPFQECLYATIYYYDKFDQPRSVELPVLTNALLEYAVPVDEDPYEKNSNVYTSAPEILTNGETRIQKIKNGNLLAFAQDGDTIYFSVEFPSFKKFDYVELKYTPHVDDSLVIDSIDVYDNGGFKEFARRDFYQDLSTDGCAIDQYLTGCKKVYSSTASSNEVELDHYVDTREFDFEAAKESMPSAYNPSGKYVITVKTDYASAAGTTDPIKAYFTYYDLNGDEKSTMSYNLMDAVNEFYGFCLCDVEGVTYVYDEGTGNIKLDNNGEYMVTSGGSTPDPYSSYYYRMRSDGEVRFIIEAKNVDEFKSMVLEYDTDKPLDNWQIASVKIDKMGKDSQIGKRIISRVDEKVVMPMIKGNVRNAHITRSYDRGISGLKSFYVKDGLHANLTPNGTMTIDFEGGKATEEKDIRNNTEYQYSMSQDIAENIDRLGEAAVNFRVQVKVAGNRASATRDDDCGSNNLFYFQLLFSSKGGTHSSSGYVLANQQLSSDGFRSGYTETFNIAVNEDVGDVVGINIIPDDVSTDSDVYDKLCATEISIIRQNPNRINKRYVVNTSQIDGGWIGQEYRDVDERDTKATRKAAEIERYFPVSYATYSVGLEIALTFGEYEATEENPDPQFVGAVTMDFDYTVSPESVTQKREKAGGYQLVECFADYAQKTNELEVQNDFIYKISDPVYMFKGGRTERFTVQIDDLYMLNSIKFYAYTYAAKSTADYIPVKEIHVYAINGDIKQTVYQDPDTDAYRIDYTKEPILIASFETTKSKNIKAQTSTNGIAPSTKFALTMETPLKDLGDSTEFESIVGRVPESRNDRMNMFVYLAPETASPQKGGYLMYVTASYLNAKNGYTTKVTLTSNEMEERTERDADGNQMTVCYKLAADARNMVNLTGFNVQAPDKLGDTSLKVSHAIVQQVRAGTVINTYRVQFGGNMFANLKTGTSMLGSRSAEEMGFEQTVRMQLAPGSHTAGLVPEKYDFAVALVYTSSIVGDDVEYESPYVYASDAGLTQVKPGSVLDFTFHEGFMGEILGIKVVGLNGLEGAITGATIKTYEGAAEDSTRTLTNRYGINCNSISDNKIKRNEQNAVIIDKNIVQLNVTNQGMEDVHTLVRADITFNMMTDVEANNIDSSGKNPISMILSYQQKDTQKYLEIPDIREYVSSKDAFTPGSSSTITLFLEGATELTDITIEPYRTEADKAENPSGSLASMNLKSVECHIEDDAATHIRNLEKVIYEGAAETINISSMQIRVDANYKIGNEAISKFVTSGTEAISVPDDTDITFAPTLGDDDYGTTFTSYIVETDPKTGKESMTKVGSFGRETGAKYEFSATANGKPSETWYLEFASSRSPSVKAGFYVTVTSTQSN